MNKSEIIDFIDNEIKARWKKWDPSDADYLDYSTFLGPFDERIALMAVQQHRSRAHRAEPILATLIQYCKEFAPAPAKPYQQPVEQLGEYEHQTFVVCVEGPAKGHFMPTTFGSDRANHEAGEQAHIAAAMQMKEKFSSYENGVIYEIITDSSYADMVRRRLDLQKDKVEAVAKTVPGDATSETLPDISDDRGKTDVPPVDEDSPEYRKLIAEIPF